MNAVRLGAAAAAGVALTAAVPAGGRIFAVAVALCAGVVLLEVASRLGTLGQRPLLPAAALGALGAPVAATAAGAAAWERLPMLMALVLVATFLVALAAPRRRTITVTLGATLLPALLVGLGTTAMIVLRSATAGFRWMVGLLLLTAVPVLLGALAARVRDDAADVPVRAVAAGAAGGALLLGLRPPFDVVTTAVLLAVGGGAGWAAAALTAVLPGGGGEASQSAADALLRPLLATFIAAPVVAFVAFATQS